MAYVASQLIGEVTAHAQSDSLEDAREICADGMYFPNKLRICILLYLVGFLLTLNMGGFSSCYFFHLHIFL